MEPSDHDIPDNMADQDDMVHLGWYFTVPTDVTWFIPAGGEGATDVVDYDRMGILLDAAGVLELWDAVGAIVQHEAEEGRL